MHYTFQESLIWEGTGDKVDVRGDVKRIKNKTEVRARRKLPLPRLGRKWILIKTED